MLTHCSPHSNYSAVSLPRRGFVEQTWGGRVSGSSPVPLGFSSSPSQLQSPPRIHSKALPHVTTPFASIIKLFSAWLGTPAPCYPKTSGLSPHSPTQVCTPHSSPTAPAPLGEGMIREGLSAAERESRCMGKGQEEAP